MEDQSVVVQVRGILVEGWLIQPPCAACGGPRLYFLAYDAICCPACNAWLELLCPEPDCWHCRCRPERPLPAGQGEPHEPDGPVVLSGV
jgi:hypothetical protein